METPEEIEEALRHASDVPEDQRGLAWHRWVDGLLDKRSRLARTEAQGRETRVVFSGESR